MVRNEGEGERRDRRERSIKNDLPDVTLQHLTEAGIDPDKVSPEALETASKALAPVIKMAAGVSDMDMGLGYIKQAEALGLALLLKAGIDRSLEIIKSSTEPEDLSDALGGL